MCSLTTTSSPFCIFFVGSVNRFVLHMCFVGNSSSLNLVNKIRQRVVISFIKNRVIFLKVLKYLVRVVCPFRFNHFFRQSRFIVLINNKIPPYTKIFRRFAWQKVSGSPLWIWRTYITTTQLDFAVFGSRIFDHLWSIFDQCDFIIKGTEA